MNHEALAFLLASCAGPAAVAEVAARANGIEWPPSKSERRKASSDGAGPSLDESRERGRRSSAERKVPLDRSTITGSVAGEAQDGTPPAASASLAPKFYPHAPARTEESGGAGVVAASPVAPPAPVEGSTSIPRSRRGPPGAPVLQLGLFAALFVLLLGGCEQPAPPPAPPPTRTRLIERDALFTVFHDDARAVTCWMYAREVSCLPDSQLAGGAR